MLVFFITLFILFTVPSQAQNNDIKILIDNYQTDYLYNRDLYQKAYFEFSEKKQIDQKYHTITTKKNKIDATKIALITRNDMLRTYIMLIRTKLNEYKHSHLEITENLQTYFQQEENWLLEQKSIINNFQNENEINNWIFEFQKRYASIKSNIDLGLLQYKINAYKKANSDTKSFLIDIQSSSILTDESKQWLDGVSQKISEVDASLDTAIRFTQFDTYNHRPEGFFENGKKELSKTNYLLNQIKIDLIWVFVKYLKT